MAEALHITEAIGLDGKILDRGTLVTDAATIEKIKAQYPGARNLFVRIDVAAPPAGEEH